MHNKHILSLLALFILLLMGCGADKNMKKGEEYLAIGEYFDAANQFKQAYRKTPTKDRPVRGLRALKMAYCYDHIHATAQAIAAYRNVERYNQATIDTHLSLGRLLLSNGDYKSAEEAFKLVLDTLPDNVMARTGMLSARQAPQWKEKGSRYRVKKMDVFNSQRSEYSPMLLGDSFDQLYFTSTRNEAMGTELSGITGVKNADIFYSHKDDKGNWTKPEPAQGTLNTEAEEGACTFSPDGRMMYLTQCLTDATYPRYAKIVTSNRSDASWGKASELNITRDTLSSYAHPAISPDGQWLYFTSDMPGGMGGLDIWRVRITAAGLGGVENLGAPINTPGDEMFPTFRPNGDFYFSSNGHPGLGGLDIYIAFPNTTASHSSSSTINHSVTPTLAGTEKAAEDSVALPYRLFHPGYPLNSQGDDFGMTFEGPYNRGFFCSNRNDARGWDHIYSFDNPEIVQTIKGWVYEMDGYELPAAQVRIVGSDGTNQTLSVAGDGSFTYVIQPNVDYLLLASCKGHLNHTEQLRVEPTEESKEYTLQFPLAPINIPVLIDNIFYDFDKATLRPESKTALDELVKLLNENGNITIELAAHCDYKGTKEYNLQLSQRRAQSVVDYLIAHGVAKDRLTPMGYGKDIPKTVRKKLTEKYNWLKENDVLTEAFIQKLDAEKQEICNQLNRRTEFRVLRITYGMFDEKGQLVNPPKKKPVDKEPIDDNGSIEISFE